MPAIFLSFLWNPVRTVSMPFSLHIILLQNVQQWGCRRICTPAAAAVAEHWERAFRFYALAALAGFLLDSFPRKTGTASAKTCMHS